MHTVYTFKEMLLQEWFKCSMWGPESRFCLLTNSIHPSINASIHPSTHPSIHPFLNQPNQPSTCPTNLSILTWPCQPVAPGGSQQCVWPGWAGIAGPGLSGAGGATGGPMGATLCEQTVTPSPALGTGLWGQKHIEELKTITVRGMLKRGIKYV